ncbi:hypothetical protein HK102_007241 [Quaeritorhiza haematococci]|nr:hypothetical protein HK102_007241 [Quaeritorhiza haematococci]
MADFETPPSKLPPAKTSPAPFPRPPLRGTVKDSFAHITIRDRMPVIVTKAIDDLYRAQSQLGLLANAKNDENLQRKADEARVVIAMIAEMKYEANTLSDFLQHDKPLALIKDHLEDAEVWNYLIKEYWPSKGTKTWYSAPWLFVECYMKAFDGSLKSIAELSNQLDKACSATLADEQKAVILRDFFQFSLWGNQTDLSLHVDTKQQASVQAMQTSDKEKLADTHSKIIVNDIDEVMAYLKPLKNVRIDIVLDNAGFELFVDLCLADWMVHSGLASEVVFHVKEYPWFVSDTTVADFEWTLDAAQRFAKTLHSSVPTSAGDANIPPSTPPRLAQWRSHLETGSWKIEVHPVWTVPHSFWDMGAVGKSWLNSVFGLDKSRNSKSSSLVIFKGDLNYRKLVYDCEWPTTTSFQEAIGPYMSTTFSAQNSDVKAPAILALRTCKSNVAVGLKEGQEKQLSAVDRDWMVNGKWGMIQFHH